jgi:hypothetical protein
VSGQTLTGKSLDLPEGCAGKPAVVVVSFTRAGGKDARAWNEHLEKDFLNFQVVELESVPKLFRGAALSSVKSGMPAAVQERSIILYRDEEVWKQRLTVSDDKRAYVLALGADGRIRWMSARAFSDSEFANLKAAISAGI